MLLQLQLHTEQQQQQKWNLWLSKRKRTSYSKVLDVFFLGCSSISGIYDSTNQNVFRKRLRSCSNHCTNSSYWVAPVQNNLTTLS